MNQRVHYELLEVFGIQVGVRMNLNTGVSDCLEHKRWFEALWRPAKKQKRRQIPSALCRSQVEISQQGKEFTRRLSAPDFSQMTPLLPT